MQHNTSFQRKKMGNSAWRKVVLRGPLSSECYNAHQPQEEHFQTRKYNGAVVVRRNALRLAPQLEAWSRHSSFPRWPDGWSSLSLQNSKRDKWDLFLINSPMELPLRALNFVIYNHQISRKKTRKKEERKKGGMERIHSAGDL